MATKYLLVSGDTLSTLQYTCENDADDLPIPLAGHTVDLQWHDETGTLVTRPMTIVDAPNGVVSYQFVAAELFGDHMSFQVRITETSSGKVMHNLTLSNIPVRRVLS